MPFEDATEGVTVPVTVAFVDLDGGGHRDVGLLARGLARLGHHVVHYAPTHQAPPGPGRYEQVRMAGGEDGTAGSSDRWELGRADVVHAFGVRSTATARAMIAGSAIPLVADWCSYAHRRAPRSRSRPPHGDRQGRGDRAGRPGSGEIGHRHRRRHRRRRLRRTQSETSAAAGRPRLLCHSRLRPEDGTDTAIAALDRVEQRHTPTRVATDLHRIYRDILDRCRIGAGGTREALLAVAVDPVLEAQTDPSWSGEGRRLPIAPSRSGGRCG